MNWPAIGTGGCGMHNVNATSDSFGNGVFDGYSIVTGHEYAEAVTDPDNFASFQDGWNDAQGSRERRQVRLDGHAEHHARRAPVRGPAALEQRGLTTRPATAAS